MGGETLWNHSACSTFFPAPVTPMKKEETEDAAEQAKRAGNPLFL